MEFINNIKWYHIIIVCLIGILIFLVFNSNNCGSTMCKNAPMKPEGFASQDNTSNPEQKQITDNSTGELVFYYALWCGYCKAFLPEWEKFEAYAKTNFPNLRVSSIRCEDGNEATCMQKGVEGYPTVILYPKGGVEKLFDGERKFESLVKFIQQNS